MKVYVVGRGIWIELISVHKTLEWAKRSLDKESIERWDEWENEWTSHPDREFHIKEIELED